MKSAKPFLSKWIAIPSSIVALTCSLTAVGVSADEGRDEIRTMALYLVNNHPSMNAARQDVTASEYDQAAAKSSLFPVVTLAGSHNRVGQDATSSSTTPSSISYNSTSFDLSLSQNLYAGGSTMAQLDKSASQLQASEYRLEDIVEVLSFRAVESHMDILRDRERLMILENSLNEHRKIAGLVQKRARMGKEPASSYSQAMSRVSLLEAEYELAKGHLKASSSVYQELTGHAPGDLNWPQLLMVDDWSVDKYIKSYVDANLGVKEAKSALASARSDSKIAKSGYLPSVDLQVSTNLMNEGNSGFDTYAAGTYEDDYQVSLNMSWGLELGGGNFDRANAASARQQIVLSNLQDRVMGVRETLKVLTSQLESARHSTNMRLSHAKEAAAVVRAYTKQYQAGSQSRSLLDLLTVENEHLTSLTNALQSRYQELLLQARISRVGGRLSNILGVN